MSRIITKEYKSSIGELIIGDFNGAICMIDWKFRAKRETIDRRIQNSLKAKFVSGNSDVIEQCILELEEYFAKARTEFSIPFMFVGSNFQKRVWQELLNIPLGETRSYLKLARTLGDELAIRAVASANGANAISIIVPCHRIIGSDGALIGYAGGLGTKKKLLQLEGALTTSQLELF